MTIDISYNQVIERIVTSLGCSCLYYPSKDNKEVQALMKLRNIAYFLNDGWHKDTINTGFFFIPITQSEHTVEDREFRWIIKGHSNVKYPGIIYFKSKNAAIKALEIACTEGWLNDLK